MLIGIAYHAALSFSVGFPWMVQDVSQDTGAFAFQAWVHGFRMQLFMLVSGFFTAMLWRQKGLKALLWHRCPRVLFPCLLGLISVVPAMGWAVGFAAKTMSSAPPKSIPAEPASDNLWSAIREGDLPAMEGHLAVSGSLTNLHPSFGTTPLTWAALTGRKDMAVALLDRGAPVDGRNPSFAEPKTKFLSLTTAGRHESRPFVRRPRSCATTPWISTGSLNGHGVLQSHQGFGLWELCRAKSISPFSIRRNRIARQLVIRIPA